MDRFDAWAETARSRIRQADVIIGRQGPVTVEILEQGVKILRAFYASGKNWQAGVRWPYQGPILLSAIGHRLGTLRKMLAECTASPHQVKVRKVHLDAPAACGVCGEFVLNGYVQAVLQWDAGARRWQETSRGDVCGSGCVRKYAWNPFAGE